MISPGQPTVTGSKFGSTLALMFYAHALASCTGKGHD
jgi:hypothetical protein